MIKKQKTIDESVEFKPKEQVRPEIYNIQGLVSTTDTVPTDNPVKFSEQFRIYKNGATKRLYSYDSVNQEWSYVTLT